MLGVHAKQLKSWRGVDYALWMTWLQIIKDLGVAGGSNLQDLGVVSGNW